MKEGKKGGAKSDIVEANLGVTHQVSWDLNM